jgi:hypothetical protein
MIPATTHVGASQVRLGLVVTGATIVAYFLPFLLLGSHSYITIHDNLDSEFIYKYLLASSGKAFTFDGRAVIDQVMNGLPRTALQSGLNVSVLLYYVLTPVAAYVANYMLVHLVAFAGMLLLLRAHVLTEDDDVPLALLLSTCFFLVPFYTAHGISVAGQPLLLYAFLNLRAERGRARDYAIVGLFPFWSSIVLVGPFLTTLLLFIWAVDSIRTRTPHTRFLVAILLFACTYAAVEYQMISALFVEKTYVSHRSTWDRWTDLSPTSNMRRSFEILLTTFYHTGSFSTVVIIGTAAVAYIRLRTSRRDAGAFTFVVAAIVAACLMYGFYDWIVFLFAPLIPALKFFNASRFYYLLPPLWFVLFAMSLREFKHLRFAPVVFAVLIAAHTYNVVRFDIEFRNNVKLLLRRTISEPSYDEFFSQELFAEIGAFIGQPRESYRVVSIGMHPSIAQFNGFYTLDSYQSNYPLGYKLMFREIIAEELGKNAALRDYFDGWGNRCYVFVDELGIANTGGRPLQHVELNTAALARMGGKYIFSASEIVNYKDNDLVFEGEFDGRAGTRKIFLYRVAAPGATGWAMLRRAKVGQVN